MSYHNYDKIRRQSPEPPAEEEHDPPSTPEYYEKYEIERDIPEDEYSTPSRTPDSYYEKFGLEREAEEEEEPKTPDDYYRNFHTESPKPLDEYEEEEQFDDANVGDDDNGEFTPQYDYDDEEPPPPDETYDDAYPTFGLEEEAPDDDQEQADYEQQQQQIEDEQRNEPNNNYYREITPPPTDDTDYSQYYTLKETVVHSSAKLHTDVRSLKLKFQNLDHLEGHEMIRQFEPVFTHIMATITRRLHGEDYFRLVFESPTLNNPIALAYQEFANYSIDSIFEEIAKVLQSYASIRLNEECTLTVTSTFIPEAAGGRTLRSFSNRLIPDLPTWLNRKQRSIVRPVNANDELCALRCIAIAKAIADKIPSKVYNKTKWQNDRAMELAVVGNLPLQALTIDQLRLLEQHLLEYQLNIYECGLKQLNVLYSGKFRPLQLNLLLHNHHYFTIRTMSGFQSAKKYCAICKIAYDHQHICKRVTKCKLCRQPMCTNRSNEKTVRILCADCDRFFLTDQCYLAHTVEICSAFARCPKCDLVLSRTKLVSDEAHQCGLFYCRICRSLRPRFREHRHFISPYILKEDDPDPEPDHDDQPPTLSPINDEPFISDWTDDDPPPVLERMDKKKKLNEKVFYADFETSTCAQSKHISAVMCCIQSDDNQESWLFHGDNTVNAFLDLIFSFNYSDTRTTIVFHYGSGFDTFCYLKAIYARHHTPSVILRGTKILCMTLLKGRLRIIDSFSFLQMSLRSMSSAFQIAESKGRFAYSLLNENSELDRYIEFPSKEMFECERMTPGELKDFNQWYDAEKAKIGHLPYHILSHLSQYCADDVALLRLACQRFRSLYVRQYGLDPFLRSITLIGSNFLAWRRTHVKPDSLALIADFGYYRTKSSRICAVWLTYVSQKHNIRIEGNHNGLEKRFAMYTVDGYSSTGPTCDPANPILRIQLTKPCTFLTIAPGTAA